MAKKETKKRSQINFLKVFLYLLRKIPINIGTFLFGAIFLYMLVSALLYVTADHIKSYQVTAGPLAQNKTYTALVLREEKVVPATGAGYITYFARENSKVAKSGVIYTLSDQPTEASLDSLTEEDLSRIRSSMSGFSSSYESSNFYRTYNYKYELTGSILLYSGMLLSEDGQAPLMNEGQTVYTAETDGLIQYTMDGYEDFSMDSLSPEMFHRQNYNITNLQTSRKIKAGDPAYKLITSEEWSILIPLSLDQTVQLSGNKTIKVKFLKDGNTQVGKLKILTDQNGDFYCKLTFTNGMIRYSNDRFLDIELVTNIRTGLKIPLSSIIKKDFYVIPKEFVSYNDEDGHAGFNRRIPRDQQDHTAEFIQATIYEEDDDYYYVDKKTFTKGDVLLKPDSQLTYAIEETKPIEGVYCINKGYAVFRKVVITDQNDEYCIIETGTPYGIAQFDHIVKDGSTVKEDDILYN